MPKQSKNQREKTPPPPNREFDLPPAASQPAAPSWPILGGVILIALATAHVYWPCRHGDFLWDGNLLITDNAMVKAPDGLFRIWFTREPVDYWPMTNSMFWLEWHLFGDNPTGYHVTNVVFQILNALLIWLILRRLSVPGAFLAALLFAVHPVNVESVAWIAQLKNVLSMFFFLVSVLWFLNAEPDLIGSTQLFANQPAGPDHRSPYDHSNWLGLSLLAFALAMLSKGSVAILPLILLLLVWWKRRRIDLVDLLRAAPFFLVAIVLTCVNIWFQTHGSGETIRFVTPLERLLGAAAVPWFYLYKALLPFDLAFIYPQWKVDAHNILWWLPLIATLSVTGLLLLGRRNLFIHALLVAWLFFCFALIPVMGLVDIYFMKFSLVSDHYQYIAIVSVLALVAALIVRLDRVGLYHLGCAVGALLAIVFVVLARQQTLPYRDSEGFYQFIVDKNPECWMAYVNRGVARFQSGQVDSAIENYEKALQLDNNSIEGHTGLGVAFMAKGLYDAAIKHFHEALRVKPDYPPAHGNLGLALVKVGDKDYAVREMQTSLQLNFNQPQISFNLAHLLKQLGHYPEALKQYQETIRLDPDNAEVRSNYGELLVAMHQPEEAQQQFKEAIRLNPELAEAHFNLANVLADQGEIEPAIDEYSEALKINPKYAAVHHGLGALYLRMMRFQQAVEEFQAAAELQPDSAEAHSNLGAALAQSGKLQPAVEQYREAVRLDPNYADAQANLAMALAQLNQPSEAIAAAEKGIVAARSQGKKALAAQLEGWLADYRIGKGQSSSPSSPPTKKSGP